MADVFDRKMRSRIMASVRTSGTMPELLLLTLLHERRLRVRRQARELPGSPDLVFDRVKLAIFVDGDFWHGRQWFESRGAPAQNRRFWIAKFEKNRNRDRLADARLRRSGWSVLRVWASDVRKRPAETVQLILSRIQRRRRMRSRL